MVKHCDPILAAAEAAYIAECKRLFNSDHYGWSEWEQHSAERSFDDGRSGEDAVARMNTAWVCRKANRNV